MMEFADLSNKFRRWKLGYHGYSYEDYGKGDNSGYRDFLRHSMVNLVQ